MARYQHLYIQAHEELEKLRKERSALDKLFQHTIAFEAAMAIMVRHKLLTEFAAEMAKLSEE